MSQSDSTIVQIDNGELVYYTELEKHINTLSEKFQAKSVVKQSVHDDIVKCLLLSKDKPLSLFSSKFIWVKNYFIVIKIAGIDIACYIKSKKPICIYESYYNVIREAHTTISHGGRDKTIHELNSRYSWIPRFAVEIFLKQCISCQTRKPIKQHVITKPIISLGVMTSKFTWAYPLKDKRAVDVALKLRELFFVFGSSRILHSDNGREFVASVIYELKELFPDMIFIRGRPRHPQSQGCIERANGVLCDALGKWMTINNSSHWSDGLLPVVYGINTRLSVVTKTTPYQVMFGQAPRSDSDFWKIAEENRVIDEEDLPTPVADLNDDNIMNDKNNDFNDCPENIDEDIIQFVQQLSDDAAASSLVDISLPHSPSVKPKPTKHDFVRKMATDNYLNVANKKIKLYQDSIINDTEKFNLNDCVGIKINTFDRTNTNANLLPCLIIEKIEKDGKITFKLACQYGKLENMYSVEHLVDLEMACSKELKQIIIDELKDITFIEACKLYVRASITGKTCDCKDKCATKQCSCKKMKVSCSTKCHSKRGGCTNMGE
ncbi:unnamed protein product [Rotaria sordida]|uniref:Integrase catalytic domain-containing protein n=1 Tax=Rotaria sordida TaxID=392033 RepID=A0A819RZ22_9BILA|nr:unnamed protein product [Rotaria sordida]